MKFTTILAALTTATVTAAMPHGPGSGPDGPNCPTGTGVPGTFGGPNSPGLSGPGGSCLGPKCHPGKYSSEWMAVWHPGVRHLRTLACKLPLW